MRQHELADLERSILIGTVLIELLLHRRVVFGQFLDGKVLRLVVGQAQLSTRRGQTRLDFLQLFDGGIDVFDRCFVVVPGRLDVLSKGCLEREEFVFEILNVNVLISLDGQFVPHVKRLSSFVSN